MKKKAESKRTTKNVSTQQKDSGASKDGGGVSKMQLTTSNTPAPPTAEGKKVTVATCTKNAKEEVKKQAARAPDKGVNGLREEFAELKTGQSLEPQMAPGYNAIVSLSFNKYKIGGNGD
uniref:Uncharacterized protein n=1 Tax=Panagrolaimus sp. PS1159 TaxID=55785 RepID=A0AC35FPT8_9BILA